MTGKKEVGCNHCGRNATCSLRNRLKMDWLCNRLERTGDTCPAVFCIYFNGCCFAAKLITFPEKRSQRPLRIANMEFVTVLINWEAQGIYRFLFVELVGLSNRCCTFQNCANKRTCETWTTKHLGRHFLLLFKLLKNAITKNI